MKNVLDIETIYKAGRSVLKKSYAAHPYKLADITEDRTHAALELMLMSASPGVLDGDHYQMSLKLGSLTSLTLRTQSYQRLFTMRTGASQCMDIRLEPGARFSYLPHPVVPHYDSNYFARNTIFLSGNAQLTWGEVVTCGRKLNGEAFHFTFFRSLTEIYCDEKLAVRDNLVMNPTLTKVDGVGLLEGYTHQASLFMIDARMNSGGMVALINDSLSMQPDIIYGVSALPVEGVVIRILGNKAEQLYNLIHSIAQQFAIPAAGTISSQQAKNIVYHVSGA